MKAQGKYANLSDTATKQFFGTGLHCGSSSNDIVEQPDKFLPFKFIFCITTQAIGARRVFRTLCSPEQFLADRPAPDQQIPNWHLGVSGKKMSPTGHWVPPPF